MRRSSTLANGHKDIVGLTSTFLEKYIKSEYNHIIYMKNVEILTFYETLFLSRTPSMEAF